MAEFSPVPTFKSGEPGFAAKLNALGDVLREVVAHLEKAEAPAPKTVRKAATNK